MGSTSLLATMILGSGLTGVLSLLYLFQIAVFAGPLVVPVLAVTLAQVVILVASTLATARYERAAACSPSW